MNDALEALRLENQRLITENNQLHQDAIKRGEASKKKDFENEQTITQLKRQYHEQLSINNVLNHQNSSIESEYLNLKRRWEQHLSSENRSLSTGEEALNNDKRVVQIKKQLLSTTGSLPNKNDEKETISLNENMEDTHRAEIDSLSEMLKKKTEELDSTISIIRKHEQIIKEMEEKVMSRDKEIGRLSLLIEGTGGRTVGVIQSDYVHKSNVETVQQLQEQIDFLQRQLETAHDFELEYEDLKNIKLERDSLSRRLKETDRKLQQLTIEYNELLRKSMTVQKQTSFIEEKLKLGNEKIRSLEQLVKQRDDDIDQLKMLCEELDRTRWLLEEDVRAFQQEAKSSDQRASVLHRQNDELKRHSSERNMQIEKLQASISDLDSKIDQLSSQLDDSEIKCARIQDSHDNLVAENEEYKRNSHDYQIKLERQIQQIKDGERQIAQLKHTISHLEEQHEYISQENRLNKDEIHNVSDDMKRLKEENQYLHSQIAKVSAEIEASKKQWENSVAEGIDLKHIISAKDEELDQLVSSYREMSSEYNKTKDSVSILERECSDLKLKLNHKDQELQHLANRLQEMEEREHQMIVDLNSFHHQNELLSNQNVFYSEQGKEIEQEKEDLMHEISHLKHMNIETEKLLAEAKTESIQKRLDLEHVTGLLTDLEGQKSKIEEENRQEKGHIFDMEKRMSELSVQLLCSTTAEKENKMLIQQLTQRLSELEQTNESLSIQVKKHRAMELQLQEKAIQLENSRIKVEDLNQKIEQHIESHFKLSKDMEAMKASLIQADEQIDQLHQELSTEKSSKDSLLLEIQDLKDESKQLKTMLSAMRQDNQRLQDLLLE